MISMFSMLATYIPFVNPIAWFHEWSYLLLVPLAFGISVIYKSLRLQSLDRFWRDVVVMTVQIVVSLALLAIGLALMVQFVVPMVPQ